MSLATSRPKSREVHVLNFMVWGCITKGLRRSRLYQIHRYSFEGVNSPIVMSKSRVAPIKIVSLPRLELLAAVIKLKFVAESLSLKIDKVLKGSSCQWKTFVTNHVAEIQFTWDPHHWRHCSGEDNPADLLTRGVPSKLLTKSDLWWNGPSWLASSCWPNQQKLNKASAECIEKERKTTQMKICTAIVTVPTVYLLVI